MLQDYFDLSGVGTLTSIPRPKLSEQLLSVENGNNLVEEKEIILNCTLALKIST